MSSVSPIRPYALGQPNAWLNPWDYFRSSDLFNAVNGTTWDAALMFQRAINDGVATYPGGFVLYIPTGVYPVYSTVLIPANGRVRIIGDGQGLTQITWGNAGLASYVAAWQPQAGASLIVEDMSISGPATTNGFGSYAVEHLGTSGSVVVRRVSASGFTDPILMHTGATCTLIVDGCDISTAQIAPGTGGILIQDILRVRVYNTRIHDFGISGSNQQHGIYVHIGVDFEASGCAFDNNIGTGYSIQAWAGAGTSPNWAVSDCFFGANSGLGVLTNSTVRSRVDNCRFTGTGTCVTFTGDVDITNCQLQTTVQYTSPIVQYNTAGNLWLRSCNVYFGPAATTTYAIQMTLNGSSARIDVCRFGCNRAYLMYLSTGNGTYWMTPTCEFADEGAAHLTVAGNTTPALSGANANIANNSISGNDARGTLLFDVITASIAAGTALFTVTFTHSFPAAPLVVLTNQTGDKVSGDFSVSAVSATAFVVRCNAALPVAAGYRVAYVVLD